MPLSVCYNYLLSFKFRLIYIYEKSAGLHHTPHGVCDNPQSSMGEPAPYSASFLMIDFALSLSEVAIRVANEQIICLHLMMLSAKVRKFFETSKFCIKILKISVVASAFQ